MQLNNIELELANLAYERHKEAFENWTEGEPVKAWTDDDGNIREVLKEVIFANNKKK